MIWTNGLLVFVIQLREQHSIVPYHMLVFLDHCILYAYLTSSPFSSLAFPPCLYSPQKHEGQLSVMQLIDMLAGVASGMKYLTEMGFVHKRLAAHKVREQVGGDDGGNGAGWCMSQAISSCCRRVTEYDLSVSADIFDNHSPVGFIWGIHEAENDKTILSK